MNNAETIIRIVCDTSHNGNKLNSFREELPHEYIFNEPYSIGLTSVSIPNSILNIRQDITLNFIFLKILENINETENIIYTDNDGINYQVAVSFSVKIPKGAYINHMQFIDKIKECFRNTTYNYKVIPAFIEQHILNHIDSILHDDITKFMEKCLQKIRNIMKLVKKSNYIETEELAIDKINNIISDISLNKDISAFISDNASFVWLEPFLTKFNQYHDLLETPKYKVKLTKISDENRNRIIGENQKNAIQNFNGKNILVKALLFYVKNIWSKYCFYIEDERLLSLGLKRKIYLNFMNTKVTEAHFSIFKSALFSIINFYFQDLLRIFTDVRIEHQTKPINLLEFIKENDNLYIYGLSQHKRKLKKTCENELDYFFKRFKYDDEKKRVTIDKRWVQMYGELTHKAKSDITLTFMKHDSSVFFGHIFFNIYHDIEYICTFQPRIVTNTEMYIYCNQIEMQITNNKLMPLLHILQSASDKHYGEMLQQTYDTPIFFKLNTRFLKILEFKFFSRDGEPILFDNSADTITLNFICRPSSKGCI